MVLKIKDVYYLKKDIFGLVLEVIFKIKCYNFLVLRYLRGD